MISETIHFKDTPANYKTCYGCACFGSDCEYFIPGRREITRLTDISYSAVCDVDGLSLTERVYHVPL
jgi:hypothetical protein